MTPTIDIAVSASPGRMLLNSLDRYLVQSSVRTLANLSSPKRIGATVKAIRSSRKACRAAVLESVMLRLRRFVLFSYERQQALVILPTGGATPPMGGPGRDPATPRGLL